MMKPQFLILDDNEIFAATLARALSRRNIDPHIVHTGEEALQVAKQRCFDYITIDLHLEKDSGLQWIVQLREHLPQARILVLTGYSSIATAVQAGKLGADNYLAKPANADTILSALQFHAPEHTPHDTNASALPTLNRLEWEHIQRVLTEHEGNISSAARALNIHRRTLQRKLAKRPVQK